LPQKQEARVIKLDIVNAVVAKTLISRTKAEQAVETVFDSLKQALGRGQRIEHPRTGEEVSIPPGKAVRFKPGKELQGIEAAKKS
jgi:DNA-binding protein HU-beta